MLNCLKTYKNKLKTSFFALLKQYLTTRPI